MRDIAGNVGIKTSSIYHYFESKEDILDCILNEFMEVVNEHKRQYVSLAGKDFVSEQRDISAETVLSYMFFNFDEQHAERNTKILKLICSESVRNERVRHYQYLNIQSNFQFIKSVLDALLEAKIIPTCDSARLATVLYSISFAYMQLSAIDIPYIGTEDMGAGMYSPLKYVLELVLEGGHE